MSAGIALLAVAASLPPICADRPAKAATVKQATADAALAYAVSDSVQVDTGANIGLTRDTPDVELYGGLSLRF